MARISDLTEIYQGLARSGRGAGVRHGEWLLRLVESSDIRDDGWLNLDGLREVEVVQSVRTERHLLRPFDLLVTARAGSVHIALVPPEVSRTVAGITLLVVRAKEPELGIGHWLWYYLTSSYGRAQLAKRLTVSVTITSLSASSLGEIEVSLPSTGELEQVVRLVEVSEEAYTSAVQAAIIRRETLRDAIIRDVGFKGETLL